VLVAVLQGLEGDARVAVLADGEGEGEKRVDVALLEELLLAGTHLGRRVSGAGGWGHPRASRLLSAWLAAEPRATASSDEAAQLLFAPAPTPVEVSLAASVAGSLLRKAAGGPYGQDWHAAAALAQVLGVLERALEGARPARHVNEAVVGPVLLTREQMGAFGSADEVEVGLEVWWMDKRAPEDPWKRATVLEVHRDDVEKYFTVRKAEGGETQTELSA
jgi:hypothetical protein